METLKQSQSVPLGQTRGQTERFPMIQPGADILTNINSNGGGQECPPTRAVAMHVHPGP